jgi:hypothetical protein
LRTIFSNPGFFEKEYLSIYSVTKFIKHLLTYFLQWKRKDFLFENLIKNENSNIKEDIEQVIDTEPHIVDKLSDNSISVSIKYHSIDVNLKKNTASEIEEEMKEKERQNSHLINDDAVESFEAEFEKFIKENELYDNLMKLEFVNDHNFCRFCLTKKVIYIIVYN